jgi:hypothetical protein
MSNIEDTDKILEIPAQTVVNQERTDNFNLSLESACMHFTMIKVTLRA